MKIIYAFLWQVRLHKQNKKAEKQLNFKEYALTSNGLFLDPEVNILGASAMVTINKLADFLTDFPMLDQDLQTGKYNPESPWLVMPYCRLWNIPWRHLV